MEDQEFEFVVKKEKNKFSNAKQDKGSYIPSITGIIPDENIQIGEIRDLDIVFRKKFTTNVCEIFNDCYYRLYVKDASNEIDVIKWHPIDKLYLTNNIMIDSNDLIPNLYYLDIKRGNDYYRDVLRFTVKSNIENKYI